MNIFPSEHEKSITTVIVSFVVGMFVGLFAGMEVNDSNIIITAISTLAAAFLGAWFAYKLQSNAKHRELVKARVDSANRTLLALFQKLNALKQFQLDSVEPWRDKPARMIGMQPLLDFKLPSAQMQPESLAFLIDTKHRQLLLDMHLESERFISAENVIRFRSNLHFGQIQPLLHAAGIMEGQQFTNIQLRDAVDDLLYTQLEQATDQVIYHVDRTVESADNLRVQLIKALKYVYPNETFINFMLLEKPPNNTLNQTGANNAPAS